MKEHKVVVEFRVLGPIELWSAGQQCDLGPTRVRSVLAILTLTPRTLVPTDVLIDRVWDTRPPPKARESLSVYVTRLRGPQEDSEWLLLAGRDVEIGRLVERHAEVAEIVTRHGGVYDGGECTFDSGAPVADPMLVEPHDQL